MSDRHTNSGPGEGELTTEDLARPGRESPDARSGPLSEPRPDAPSDTGHDAPPDARSGPLPGARPDRTAERSSDTPPPAYPGEASAVSDDGRGVPGARESVPERTATGEPAGAPERTPLTERDDRDRRPDGDQRQGGGQPRSVDEGADPLIAHQEADTFRERWAKIQGTFVDDPKDAVRSADALVADVIQSLAATFADHKKELEGQWSRGEQVETEGLRVALQQYRTFFNQLLDA
ncbi:hypothetical protein [Streptomyces griseoluteus]|uniref:hypothetical protein n=1 Tax=Streptomyces griseoluteus TaxID=29306 RepID=UPI0019C616B1|nr:hypothetical protein [Streptomyces griseoluteus]GHF01762.1 hypothetical protein GCM10017776_18930 [Streptomyces griseoluteus]